MSFMDKYLEQLLIEGRVDDAKKKYPKAAKVVEYLASKDPSGNNKYLMWMTRQASDMIDSGEWSGIGAEKLADIVNSFHKNIQRLNADMKDINKFKTVKDLEHALEPVISKETRKEEKERVREGATVVYEDETIFVIRPDTEEASCYYGRGTQWCISATEFENYFERYSNEGKTFYFLRNNNYDRDDANHKIALVYSNNGWEESYDATDSSMDEREVKDSVGELKWNKISKAIDEHLEDNPPGAHIGEKLAELLDQYSFEYVSVDYEEYDTGHWDFRAYTSFDFENLEWNDSYSDAKISDKLYSAVHDAMEDNNVYMSNIDVETYDGERKVMVNFNTSEGYYQTDQIEVFEAFLGDLEDGIEKKYDKIFNESIENLEERGYIAGGTLTKLKDIANNIKLTNLQVKFEGKVLQVGIPINVKVGGIKDLPALHYNKSDINRNEKIDQFVGSQIRVTDHPVNIEAIRSIQNVISGLMNVAINTTTLPGFKPSELHNVDLSYCGIEIIPGLANKVYDLERDVLSLGIILSIDKDVEEKDLFVFASICEYIDTHIDKIEVAIAETVYRWAKSLGIEDWPKGRTTEGIDPLFEEMLNEWKCLFAGEK